MGTNQVGEIVTLGVAARPGGVIADPRDIGLGCVGSVSEDQVQMSIVGMRKRKNLKNLDRLGSGG